MRQVQLTPHFTRHAEGSVLAAFGDTRVLCTASVEAKVPQFLKGKAQGWVTAEYGMLPRATHTRTPREASRGAQSGRTLEIQRLIGRSLRAVVDRDALAEHTITIDCDVLQADGGTRTAAITGGYVALAMAAAGLVKSGKIVRNPIHGQVAAVSVGIFRGDAVLDLDYAEDSEAETDMNVVMNDAKGFIEVQGTAEGHALQRSELERAARLGLRRHRAVARGSSRRAREVTLPAQWVLATSNAGKVAELSALLAEAGLDLRVTAQSALGVSAPAETGATFVENALLKARHAAHVTGLPAIADDSGLVVDALCGAPGIRSARFAGEQADDRANIAKLLQLLAEPVARAHGALSLRARCPRASLRCGPFDRVGLVAR